MTKAHYFYNIEVALLVLVTFINDHFLKYQYPGFFTGIISDFAGLFFFPLFVACAIERMQKRPITPFCFKIVSLISAIAFVVFKFFPKFRNVLIQGFEQFIFPIEITPDPIDVFAISSLLIVIAYYKSWYLKFNRSVG